MFGSPQPGPYCPSHFYRCPILEELPDYVTGGETWEGCPAVMYDVPIELSHLIKALYDGA